jgi:Ca2+-binding RTX toxin-like protein
MPNYFIGGSQFIAFVPNGSNIHFRGEVYRSDFTIGSGLFSTFMHEVQHIKQAQDKGNIGYFSSFLGNAFSNPSYQKSYEININSNWEWGKLNIEQQARAVEAYLELRERGQHRLAAELARRIPDIYDITEIPIPTERPQCFPANTRICLWNAPHETAISSIRVGDVVKTFDPKVLRGRDELVPRRVTKLFRNLTKEWIRLKWCEAGELKELVCTPGHHFLDEFGNFPPIADMIYAGGATVVLASGELTVVTAERIVYSVETAHLFERARAAGMSAGGAALQPFELDGWQTYNFEVEDLHSYVAGGVRVHNISEPWAHEQLLGLDRHVTERAIQVAHVPRSYAESLGRAALGFEDIGNGRGVGYTSAGRSVDIDVAVMTAYINAHGGRDASDIDHAVGEAYGAISAGASRTDAMAAAYREAEKRGVDTNSIEFTVKVDRATHPDLGSSGKGGEPAQESPRSPNVTDKQSASQDSSGKSGGGESQENEQSASSGKPVLFDLDGDGLSIEQLNTSDTFVEMEGDGYEHRTAWVDAGDGVLVLDADGDGKISDKKEFIFTEWDPGSESDFDALKKVFDTDHDGELDSGDARWSDFRIMVNGQLVTLAALGIVSIDLTATGSGQSYTDGSAIAGTSNFTRADGTTGLVGDAVFAMEDKGYKIVRTPTTNADGSTTTDLKAYNPDGSLAFREVITVSADGLATTTQHDDDGDAVVDRSQSVQRVLNGDGSKSETISNFRADGSLADRMNTTTSADLKSVLTELDQDGDGVNNQTQQYTKNADGSSSTRTKELSVSGALLKDVLIIVTADGLTKTVKTDREGNGAYELTRTEATVVNGDGGRTKTVSHRGGDNALISSETTSTSANGAIRTVVTDKNGDMLVDVKQSYVTTMLANGDVVITEEKRDRLDTLHGRTTTTTSGDGLSKTVQQDLTGDAVLDRILSQVSIDANETRVITKTVTSGGNTLLSKSVQSVSNDQRTISLNEDSNGDGAWDRTTSILADGAGATTKTVSVLASNGTLLSREHIDTSADGLSVTTRTDLDGDGFYDRTKTRVVVLDGDGSSAATERLKSRNDTLMGETVTTRSADGLTTTVQQDLTGDGYFDSTATTTIVLNGDGSRTTTEIATSRNGSMMQKTTSTLSADKRTLKTQTDANGDFHNDVTVVDSIGIDGDRMVTSSEYNANGTLKSNVEQVTSASKLSITTKTGVNGDGTWDGVVTDVTTINADTSTTRIVSNLSANNTVLSKSYVWTDATGYSINTKADRDGNGVYERIVSDFTGFNADGSATQTIVETAQNASVLSQKTINTSATGLSVVTQTDYNGDGIMDVKGVDTLALNSNGSTIKTESLHALSGSVLISKVMTTTAADQKAVTIDTDFDGDAVNDQTTAILVNANGSKTTTASTFDAGQLESKAVSTVSGNGLISVVQVDLDGDSVYEREITDATVYNADGSTTRKITELDGGNVLQHGTTIDTSADGLTVTSIWDGNGNGAFSRKEVKRTVLNADGSSVVTTTNYKTGNVLNDKVTVTVSNHGLITTTSTDLDGNSVNDQVVTVTIMPTGSSVATYIDYSGSAIVGETRVTTSADGLSITREHVPQSLAWLNRLDWASTDITVIDVDGSRVRTVSEFNVTYASSEVRTLRSKAVITTSGNGRSINRQWDLTGSGSYGKSETDIVTLNEDGSETRTLSNYAAGAMTMQEVTTTSGNGLSTSVSRMTAAPGGNTTETSTDITVINTDGTRTRTVVNKKSDGSTLSKYVTLTSADGRTLTVQEDLNGDGSFDRTRMAFTKSLADTGSRTVTAEQAADGSVTAIVTTTVQGDGLTSLTERDLLGDGKIDQVELKEQSIDGNSITTISNYLSNGNLASRTVKTVSFDGRTSSLHWDFDGDGAIDQTRVLVATKNADGSSKQIATDYTASNTVMRKETTVVSADGRTQTITRDDDGDGDVDHTETVVWDVTGAWAATIVNTQAALTPSLDPGVITWNSAIAAKLSTTFSADGLTKVVKSDYDNNGTYEHVETSRILMDGRSVTSIVDTNSAGATIATGTMTVSADGNIIGLLKDKNNDGTIDLKDETTTQADGSVIRVTTTYKPDGSVEEISRTLINADGKSVVILGTTGADKLKGTTADDRYSFGRGDGKDTISDPGSSVGDVMLGDRIRFGAGIGIEDIIVRKYGNDLIISVRDLANDTLVIKDIEDKITIKNWASSTNRVELLEFDNGQVMNISRAANMILGKDMLIGGDEAVGDYQHFAAPVTALSNAFGSAASAGSWASQNVTPRRMADVNGDGRADIVGFATDGVKVSLGQADGTFAAPFQTGAAFNTSYWSNENLHPRQLGDVNGDGRADIIGIGAMSIAVALGQANGTFGAAYTASSGYFGGDPNGGGGGWYSMTLYPRYIGDVNGDGRDDIVGFGSHQVLVGLATAAGTFSAPITALSGHFVSTVGWNDSTKWLRRIGDVNGDGRADIVAFGADGVQVALGKADGTFELPIVGLAGMFGHSAEAGGWANASQAPREVADVNGDGRVDIVAFGANGPEVAFGKADGTFSDVYYGLFNTFGSATAAGGWTNDSSNPRLLGDVDGDGKADIVAFNPTLVEVALSQTGTRPVFNETLTGTTDADVIYGFQGNDAINGGDGGDWLFGGEDNDAVSGGAGNDEIYGGKGNDTLTGGSGSDAFVFTPNFGHDTVTDFSAAGGDVVQFDKAVFANWAQLLSHAVQSGSNVVITADPSNSVTLQNVALSSLQQSNFQFGAVSDRGSNVPVGGVMLEDRIRFGAGIGIEDIIVRKYGNDLIISVRDLANDTLVIKDIEDKITIKNWASSTNRVELLEFDNGQVMNISRAANMILGKDMLIGGDEAVGDYQHFAAPVTALSNAFGSAASAGSWASQNVTPRRMADVNGDGRADIVGFATDGVKVSLGQADGTFAAPFQTGAAFNTSYWSNENLHPRQLGDVNGDGRADIIGIGAMSIAVALGQANGTFGAAYTASSGYFGGDPNGGGGGWYSMTLYPRYIGDVNGDGRDDIVGFGSHQVLVGLATAAGTFSAPITALSGHFVSTVGWNDSTKWLRRIGDVNGDGRADIIAFGADGVQVALGKADGTFELPIVGLAGMFGHSAEAGGWANASQAPREVADVNGDGRVDIVAFGANGPEVAFGKADGTFSDVYYGLFNTFGSATAAGGWTNDSSNPRLLGDVDGDGKADIVAFNPTLVEVALSQTGTRPVFNETLTGTTDADVIYGFQGNDAINGGDGGDWLFGGEDNDAVSGGAGNDEIYGGKGNDTLTGGSGSDAFVFTPNFGHDTVTDFSAAGGDVVQFDKAVFANWAQLLSHAVQSGSNVVITADPSNSVTLQNVALSSLQQSNFQFGAVSDRGSNVPVGGVMLEDRIRFGAGIGIEDIIVQKYGNDLIISVRDLANDTLVIKDIEDKITIKNWASSTNRVELLEFDNGQVMNISRAANMILGKDMLIGGDEAVGDYQHFAAPVTALSNAFGSAASAGSWASQNVTPRRMADVNGDGRADIVGFTSNGTRVAIGQANGTFAAPVLAETAFGASNWNNETVYPRQLGDVNGDGRADIIGFYTAAVYVALGQANGTFGAAYAGYGGYFGSENGWSNTTLYPRYIGDVNGDGRDDIVGFGSDRIMVSLATAAGTFSAPITALSGHFVSTVGWNDSTKWLRRIGDVNGDGRADIIAFGADGVQVALGKADGTFELPIVGLAGMFGHSAEAGGWANASQAPREVADVNGDGRVDIVAFGANGPEVAFGKADGTFSDVYYGLFNTFGSATAAGGWTNDSSNPRLLGDVDGDGKADIVAFNPTLVEVALSQTGTRPVFNETLTGTTDADVIYGFQGNDAINGGDGGDWLFGGEDNDAVSGGAGNDEIYGGKGNDTLTGGSGSDAFVFTPNFGHDTVTDFSAAGGDVVQFDKAVFANWAQLLSHAVQSGSNVVITADPSNSITLQNVALSSLQQSNFQFGAVSDRGSNVPVGGVMLEDRIRFGAGIGIEDIIVRKYGNDLIISVRDLANDTLVIKDIEDKITIKNWASSTNRVELLEFDNGQVMNISRAANMILGKDMLIGGDEAVGDYQHFAAPVTALSNAFGSAASAGSWASQNVTPRRMADVNGDGRADIVGFATDGVKVSLGQADGTFAAPFQTGAAFNTSYWSNENLHPRQLGDVNGDGRADIIGIGAMSIAVALGQANGTFGAAYTASSGYFGGDPNGGGGGWYSMTLYPRYIGDVNGDGRDDIVGFGSHQVLVGLATAAGTFSAPITALSGHFVSTVGWNDSTKWLRRIGDVNGDGRADIVAFGADGVQVALGKADGTFELPIVGLAGMFGHSAEAGGWANASQAPREVADVNGDGRVDIVAFGANGPEVAFGKADGTFSDVYYGLFNTFGSATAAGGWTNDSSNPRLLGDVDGDGKADIVAFNPTLVEVALSQTGTRPVFNETLTGTTDADVIYGFQGNDAINGGDGGDWLFGGEDNDAVSGGAGNDEIYGGKGNDTLTGGSGSDAFVFTPELRP